jgi:hypothetical protein
VYVQWSKAIALCLWPFAHLHATYLLNHLPRKDGTTRAGQFAGSGHKLNMQDQRTFGCPVYVLQDPLQMAGGKIPKWNSRVRLGVYLGQLPVHASTVLLMLNPMTGHVSAQLHCVFDDDFATIDNIHLPRQMTEPSHWKEMCQVSTDSHIDKRPNIDSIWPMFESNQSSPGQYG